MIKKRERSSSKIGLNLKRLLNKTNKIKKSLYKDIIGVKKLIQVDEDWNPKQQISIYFKQVQLTLIKLWEKRFAFHIKLTQEEKIL